MKKNLLVVLVLCLIGLVGCQKESDVIDLAQIEERGYVIMGLDDTFAPMGFRNDEGELTGFDVELAKEVFARAGIELRFQPIDWSLKETELNAGNIDMIWNGYTITDDRKEKVLFSEPYLSNAQVLIVLSNSFINEIDDLDNLIIATQASSSSFDALLKSSLMDSRDESEIILFDTYNEAFLDLEAERVDVVVADEILARYYIQQKGYDNYYVLNDNLGFEQYGIGFRRESVELQALVDELLDQMIADGTAGEISTDWFAEDIVQ